ncbi:MAG: hypothetical protein CVV62_00555 [Tenericutes bacterium HGW-Tenericutes-7]|nr:MAG: hypothetical protein CVV62_00555 [Tenericutes bacterium HGW-Tenericutes-7]
MEEGTAKRYYKKINTTFEGVNRLDDFAKQYLNLIESSKLELYQKERRERRIFDDSWLKNIEGIIPIIDKLMRSPKETLKKVSEVVPVERAKKIDSNTIRHLAANTQLIKKTNRKGEIQPTKLLTTFSEQELGTYENRFLMTLVDKIYTFIEIRFRLINHKMNTEYVNFLKVNSTVEYLGANIDFDITLSNSSIKNMPFFVNDSSTQYFNTFEVICDDVNLLHGRATFSFQSKESIKILFKVNYYDYTMDNEFKPWHKPEYDITLSARFTMMDIIFIRGEIVGYGKSYAKIYEYQFHNSIPLVHYPLINSWVDFNLGIEYRYNKNLSIFADFNNIGNISYMKWYNYPVQRFSILGGLSYSF